MITAVRRWLRAHRVIRPVLEPSPGTTYRQPGWRLRLAAPPRPSAWWMIEIEAPRGVRVVLVRTGGRQYPVVLGRDGSGKRVMAGLDLADLVVLIPDQDVPTAPQVALVPLTQGFAERLMHRKIRLAVARGHVSPGRNISDPLHAYEQTMKAFASGLLGGDLPDWSANEEALARRDDALQAIVGDAEARWAGAG